MASELIDVPVLPESPFEKVDAIVVLGKNLGIGWGEKEIREQRFHLSPHSRINVLAAGVLYKEGYTNKIIFSTGRTAGTDLSEAELMKRHLMRIFPSIPEADILLEEISWDTNTNGKMLKKKLKEWGLNRAALLTTSFHLERAEYLLRRAGVNLDDLFASDEVLGESRSKFVEAYQDSEIYVREEEREETGLPILRKPLAPEALSIITGIFTRRVGLQRMVQALG